MKPSKYYVFALVVLLIISSGILKSSNPVWVNLDSLYPALKNDFAERIRFDKSEVLWMLTEGGFIKFQGENYTKFLYPGVEFDAGQYIFDNNNKIWACGRTLNDPIAQHVVVFDGVNVILYDTNNSNIRGGMFSAVACDSSGKIWVGYDYDQGIASEGGVEYIQSVNGSTWTIFKYDGSPYPAYHTNVIEVDKNGIVWFGTNNGLVKYDNGNWTSYTSENSGLPYDDISAIAFDSSGNKWIGTSYMGVAMFDDVSWTVYNSGTSQFGSNYVRTVAVDNNDTIWCGTEDDGIKYWKSGNWWTGFPKEYYPQLPSNNVRKILIDKYNNKIVETDRGVVIFNEAGVNLPQFSSVISSNEDNLIIRAYPNPFTNNFNIRLNLPEPGFVNINLYNSLGIKVDELLNDFNDAGENQLSYHPKNLVAGIYYLRMNYRQNNQMIKITYLPE